ARGDCSTPPGRDLRLNVSSTKARLRMQLVMRPTAQPDVVDPRVAELRPRFEVVTAGTILSVPLQELGTDVAVRFSVTDCQGMPCPPGALVIDDLKLE
ncbi:MAG TPA: hypothetical protein VGF76_17640, partial [Polyangiaceae bacterium]